MGLAAGQARLLTITGRKSDCEFASMRLSHEKIALARELADISNEYQNSLEQTKLIYDYYGTGDTSMPVSYSLLMTPSALNNYMPTLLSDSMNRIVLNSKYARAAEEAGIPREGLGCLPSETIRNDFINALYGQDLINKNTAEKIVDLPYNQAAGLGGGATVVTNTQEVSYSDLVTKLENYYVTPLDTYADKDITEVLAMYIVGTDNTREVYINDIEDGTYVDCNYYYKMDNNLYGASQGNNGNQANKDKTVTLADLLRYDVILMSTTQDNLSSTIGNIGGALDAIVNSSVWDGMMNQMEDIFDSGDAYTQLALNYAREKINEMISNNSDPQYSDESHTKGDKWRYFNQTSGFMSNIKHMEGGAHTSDGHNTKARSEAIRYVSTFQGDSSATNGSKGYLGYIGICGERNYDSGKDDKNGNKSVLSVNVSSVFKAYLTYFTDFMNGLSKTDKNGNELYYVGDTVGNSTLIDGDTKFNIKIGTDVSSDDLALATFYDTLFNQLCLHGWCENNNVNDNDYLKELLQNGMVYISNIKDDNYYYQENYATDKYIKEVADESLIAQAEAKYNTEKAKLNAKEQTIDLKMKNLDTEISALTTEYDTVKNTISKNIDRGFKRYNA